MLKYPYPLISEQLNGKEWETSKTVQMPSMHHNAASDNEEAQERFGVN